MITAKDIMVKKLITASPKEQIKKIVSKMEKYGVKEIPIVEKGKFIGMITYYDILDFVRIDPNEKVSTLMIKPPSVDIKTEISKIIELMLKTGVEAIPVINEDNKLVGLISDYDILKKMLNHSKIKKLRVRDVMNESIKLLREDDSISLARRVMRHNKWEKLPIVNSDGKLLGVITSMDILTRFYKIPKEKMGKQDKSGKSINLLMLPVKALMKKNIPEAHPKERLTSALNKIFEAKIKGMPVTDDEGRVIGIFERWSVLNKLIERRFKEGVWLNFSGFSLPIETIEILKNYLSSDIKRMKTLCPNLKKIDIHIKKIHGASPEKWNYEVHVHLIKTGKNNATSQDVWYGYNLMFTLKDAFNRLITQLQKEHNKKFKGKKRK